MTPSATVQKSVTPESVKALMIIEAIVIAFFSFWLGNEYVHNVYFRIYTDGVFIEHFTTYTIALGLGIGLAGTAAAAALYKNLREAKLKLESFGPKIRGSVEKVLASVPSMEQQVVVPPTGNAPIVIAQLAQEASPTANPIPPISPAQPVEEKK